MNKNLKARKILTGILLLIILFSSGFFYPRQVKAQGDGSGWPHFYATVGGWASAIADFVKISGEALANIAAASFRKMILDMIVEEIIAWVSGEGTSAFDTGDWGEFFDNAAQDAGAMALQQIVGPGVMGQLCDSGWAGKVEIALQTPKKFAEKARCTLKEVGANFDDFMDNFENGGWAAWIKVSESQNNPYGYFLSAIDEKLAKETQKKLGLEKELTASGGFLSDKVCLQIACLTKLQIEDEPAKYKIETNKKGWKEDEIPYADIGGIKCTCNQWETRTPGKIMADSLAKTTFKDVDWLQENSEWYNYVAAIGNAVVNRMTKEGVKAIKASVPRGSPTSKDITGKADLTPPLTSVKILDPWRVKLTANEPGTTYFTLDGSKPRVRASPKYEGEALTIVSSSALRAPASQLKWLSLDDNNNAEDPRSLPISLRSPFNYSDLDKYIKSQNTSIPDNIRKELIKFFKDEENGKDAVKIAEETFIPADIRNDLKDYLEIENLRIELKKNSILSKTQRGQLDDILSTYDDFKPANDGKLADLIDVLSAIKNDGINAFVDIQTAAEETRDSRNNLQKTLDYLNEVIAVLEDCSDAQAKAVKQEEETPEEFKIRLAVEFDDCQTGAQAGAFPVSLSGLSLGLAGDPLFSELKDKTDKVILERSLFTIDSAGNWTEPSASLAPADSEHVAIISFNPSASSINTSTAIFFKHGSWQTSAERNLVLSYFNNNRSNGFYYKQALAIPIPTAEGSGTQIWYGAIDAKGAWTEEKATPEFNTTVNFEKLPPITDFVKPIAAINEKKLDQDSAGYFILDPSLSVDQDKTPQIIGYE